MFFRETHPTNTPEKGLSVAQCSPSQPPSGTTWHEKMGWRWQPFMFFPMVGAQGPWWLLSPTLGIGSGVLFLTVVLSWGQPKTLPGWHMLVGEERTERDD